MSAETFVDSNILLYACSAATEDAAKQHKAESLILNISFAVSTQVVQEIIANALRKSALGISETGIDSALELLSNVQVLPVTLELVINAVALRRRFQISHWDSTILAAALELGCHTLYSEDLSHGQYFDGVQIINPFL